jgi:hypothetical protein
MSDKHNMKRLQHFLSLMTLSTLLVLASCGTDNSMSGNKSSSTNSLTGNNCSCPATYSPVYYGTITYDNSCIAACHGVTKTYPGNYECRAALPVCSKDIYTGQMYNESECDARNLRHTVIQWSPCGSATR